MTTEAAVYSYPRTATPQDLYSSMRLLVDQLRRVRAQDGTDAAALQATADQIGATVAAQVESGLLTPAEAFDLAVSAASASIFGEAATSTNQIYAAASQLQLDRLTAAVQSYAQAAAITVEQTVRQSETESLASQITTVNAALATTNAAITTEATARVTGDSANAAAITTVQTQANGNTAAITQALTSNGGTTTNWAVTTNTNRQVTGMVALNGSESGTAFVVVADKFVVALPGAPGTTIQAFVAGLVNGVPTVGINGNLLVDGTILARSINVATLSAISANIGTVTAGLIRNTADTLRFDLPNMRIYRTDGTMDLNFGSKFFRIET
jgi:hypothetical protein